MTIKQWIETVLGVILLAIVLWIAWLWRDMHNQIKELNAYKAQAVPVLAATQGGVTKLDASVVERQAADSVVAQSRAVKDRRYNEAIRHDQTSANWASTPIPDSVRASETDPAPVDGPADTASGSEAADIAAYNRWSVPKPGAGPHKRRSMDTGR